MVLGNDSTGDEFESTLKKHARELVDCLERGGTSSRRCN